MHSVKIVADQQREYHWPNPYHDTCQKEDEASLAESLDELWTSLDRYHRGKHAQAYIVENPQTSPGNVPKIWMHSSQPAEDQAGQEGSSTHAQTDRNCTDANAQQADDRPTKNANPNETEITRVGWANRVANKLSDAFHIALRTTDPQNVSF